MNKTPFDYKPSGLAAKKVLTDIVSKDLPTKYPSQYFSMLWTAISNAIKWTILSPEPIKKEQTRYEKWMGITPDLISATNTLSDSDKQRLGIHSVWDIVRFTLKGGTSILEAINFILELEGRDPDIVEIRDNWENSDWDSMLLINPSLPENVYFEVLKICFAQIFFVSVRFKTVFDDYLSKNLLKYQFNLTPAEITKMYPAEKWAKRIKDWNIRRLYTPEESQKQSDKISNNISSVTATLITGVPDMFRDYARDKDFKNNMQDDNTKHERWKLAEIEFSNDLMKDFSNKPRTIVNEPFLINAPSHYSNGLTAVSMNAPNKGYLRESLNRSIRVNVTLSPDERFFNYNFDLYRLMIPFELIITTKNGDRYRDVQFSELIDITVQYRSFEKYFKKLTLESILPTVGLPAPKGKKNIKKRDYPSVGIDYNISDAIRVINETGNKDGKLEKRCKRTLGMLKLKCKEEKYYRPDIVEDDTRCEPKIPREINEETCRNNPSLKVDWGTCIDFRGVSLSKRQLVDWFSNELDKARRHIDRNRLMAFKKEYLCQVYHMYLQWVSKYPDISNRLVLLLEQIFIIYEKELELHPKLVSPVIDLPENLMDILLLRNVFIDLQFRDFLYEIKTFLVEKLSKAYFEIENMLNPNEFEGIYVVGGSAYTLLHQWVVDASLKEGIPVDTLVPPYKSFDFDSNIFTTIPCGKLETTKSFENTLTYLIDGIQLSSQEVKKLNATNPRFRIASRDDLKDVQDKWHHKYLSNLIAPTEAYEGRGSPYTFLSLDRYNDVIVIRLNIIIYDVKHDFYRMEHFVELFFRCVPNLPKYREGIFEYWIRNSQSGGIKFSSPFQLFNQNYNAMINRRKQHNVKWAIDRERLEYLCRLNVFMDRSGIHLLSDDQFRECQDIVNLIGEARREFDKEQEYMKKFIREMELRPKTASGSGSRLPPGFLEIPSQPIRKEEGILEIPSGSRSKGEQEKSQREMKESVGRVKQEPIVMKQALKRRLELERQNRKRRERDQQERELQRERDQKSQIDWQEIDEKIERDSREISQRRQQQQSFRNVNARW